MNIITVENLTKTFRISRREPGIRGALKGMVSREYREVHALDNLSFVVEAGELVAYIGPNGAGKSTTVKTLSGILVPDSGTCRVLGFVPWKERRAYVSHIGVVFGQRTQLWWDLPVIESFDLLREIYRTPHLRYQTTRDELVEMLDLSDLLDTPVRQLSLGQRSRCDIAASLLHGPELLFLDEPTIGLDAVSKLAVRKFIKQLNVERGVTVILTTHDLDDVEALCSRVMMIGGGKLLLDGSLEHLRRHVTPERWLILDLLDATDAVQDPDAHVIRREGSRITLYFDPARVAPAALIGRVTARYAVSDLFVENPPIEQIIASLYAEHAK